jgi:hypothetical protein
MTVPTVTTATTATTVATLTARAKVEILCAILAIALFGVGVYSWLGEHDARLKADQSAKVAQVTIDKDANLRKAEAEADVERDKQTAATVAKIQTAAAAQKTPAQIVKWIPLQLHAPAPVQMRIPTATPADPVPDAIVDVPQVDLAPIRDIIAKCQAQAAELGGCTKDAASLKLQMTQAGEQLSKMTAERDEYKKAAGRTKWQRAEHVLEIVGGVAAGAGVGYAAGRAHK